MILVDTSIWIDHFRKTDKNLQNLLLDEKVSTHKLIVGELACGNLSNRKEILGLLNLLPQTKVISDDEVLQFIELNKLYGTGLGFIDVHLLASALISDVELWTNDKRLEQAATKLHCSYKLK